MKEGQRGERGQGQGGPRAWRLQSFARPRLTLSEMAKLKKPAFTTPALARQSPDDREKNSPLPGAPRAVKCPPTNSDLRCRTAPPTSTRMDWNTLLDLYAVLMKIYYIQVIKTSSLSISFFSFSSVLALLSSRNIFQSLLY